MEIPGTAPQWGVVSSKKDVPAHRSKKPFLKDILTLNLLFNVLLTELSQKYYDFRHKSEDFLMLLSYLSLFLTTKGTKRSALSVGVGQR